MQKIWNFVIYIREGYFMHAYKEFREHYEPAMEDTDETFKYVFLPPLLIIFLLLTQLTQCPILSCSPAPF